VVYHVYILASANSVLYTGVTNHLERRVYEHRRKVAAAFTRKYDIGRLVYFEAFADVRNAIAREKQLKKWRREKKLALIRELNPGLDDLSVRFFASEDAEQYTTRSVDLIGVADAYIKPRSLHCAARAHFVRGRKSGLLRSG
jgi:putative endonuclease